MKFEYMKKGFKNFVKWAVGYTNSSIPLHFTMEATGVYYESLAYSLVEAGLNTHVLLPNTSKYFFGRLNAKNKTDKEESFPGQSNIKTTDNYIRQFERENKRLKDKRDILKKRRYFSLRSHKQISFYQGSFTALDSVVDV